jgi:hypothetical protein
MTTPLITRLEEAAEGSRELDCRVAAWLMTLSGPVEFHVVGPPTYEHERYFCAPAGMDWIGYDLLNSAPAYTRSLDAALALASRVLPGLYMWNVEYDDEPTGTPASARVYAKTDGRGYAATPAIAMCIAILKATRASHD